MLCVSTIIFLASIASARSQWQAQQAKSGYHVGAPFRAQSPRLNSAPAPLTPQGGSASGFPAASQPRSSVVAQSLWNQGPSKKGVFGETKEAPKGAKLGNNFQPEGAFPQNELNIYGEKTQACNTEEQEYCTYKGDSPKLCVDVKPFDPPVLGVSRFGDIGPRCLTIWALGVKPVARGQFRVSDFDVLCPALPVDVLSSKYTEDEWNNCYLYSKGYTTEADKGYDVVSIEKTYVKDEMSSHCFRFRKAVNSICNTCIEQAPSDSAKEALRAKCAALDGNELELAESKVTGSYVTPGSLCAMACCTLVLLGLSLRSAHKKLGQVGQEHLLAA
jgi:hypothetical protein